MKIYSILTIFSIISVGILTALYLIPPSNPTYIDTAGWGNNVFVSGDYVYVTDWHNGLVIIDVSDPLNPGTPLVIDTMSIHNSLFVSGDYAYVTSWSASRREIFFRILKGSDSDVSRQYFGF